jgi:hypothetical protein
VIAALVCAGLGAAVILSLPETPADSPAASSSVQAAEETTASAGDQSCEKQAWPYLDQRCAEPVKQESGQPTREVRVVSTDRGTSPTIVTAIAPAETKRPATPPQPPQSVATLESPTAPAEPSAPSPKQPAPAIPDFITTAAAAGIPDSPAAATSADNSVASAQAPETPTAASKLTTAAKTNRKPQVKQVRLREQKTVPADVVEAVETAALRDGNHQAVPPDVIEAVRAASGSRARVSGDGRRITVSQKYRQEEPQDVVSVNYPSRSTQRLVIVPRESVEVSDGW